MKRPDKCINCSDVQARLIPPSSNATATEYALTIIRSEFIYTASVHEVHNAAQLGTIRLYYKFIFLPEAVIGFPTLANTERLAPVRG